jgi:colanic acid biosynthesis protein WcaH
MTAPADRELADLAARLLERVEDARAGLPREVFLLVSRLTPLVNVDLLVRNDQGQTLLTWRADEFYGPGWHIPGGIVRFKESFARRLDAVARAELGADVRADPHPLTVREIVNPTRDVRGHFISFLYRCELLTSPDPALEFTSGAPKEGQWYWHDRCPENLIRVQDVYRPYFEPNTQHP